MLPGCNFIRRLKMNNVCYWGTKDTNAHVAQCLTSCHHPEVRAIVTDECCYICPYREEKEDE